MTPDELVLKFNASNHPDVQMGIKSPAKLQSEFLESFDVRTEVNNIYFEDFEKYYINISACIQEDVLFEQVLFGSWGISFSTGAQANLNQKIIARKNVSAGSVSGQVQMPGNRFVELRYIIHSFEFFSLNFELLYIFISLLFCCRQFFNPAGIGSYRRPSNANASRQVGRQPSYPGPIVVRPSSASPTYRRQGGLAQYKMNNNFIPGHYKDHFGDSNIKRTDSDTTVYVSYAPNNPRKLNEATVCISAFDNNNRNNYPAAVTKADYQGEKKNLAAKNDLGHNEQPSLSLGYQRNPNPSAFSSPVPSPNIMMVASDMAQSLRFDNSTSHNAQTGAYTDVSYMNPTRSSSSMSNFASDSSAFLVPASTLKETYNNNNYNSKSSSSGSTSSNSNIPNAHPNFEIGLSEFIGPTANPTAHIGADLKLANTKLPPPDFSNWQTQTSPFSAVLSQSPYNPMQSMQSSQSTATSAPLPDFLTKKLSPPPKNATSTSEMSATGPTLTSSRYVFTGMESLTSANNNDTSFSRAPFEMTSLSQNGPFKRSQGSTAVSLSKVDSADLSRNTPVEFISSPFSQNRSFNPVEPANLESRYKQQDSSNSSSIPTGSSSTGSSSIGSVGPVMNFSEFLGKSSSHESPKIITKLPPPDFSNWQTQTSPFSAVLSQSPYNPMQSMQSSQLVQSTATSAPLPDFLTKKLSPPPKTSNFIANATTTNITSNDNLTTRIVGSSFLPSATFNSANSDKVISTPPFTAAIKDAPAHMSYSFLTGSSGSSTSSSLTQNNPFMPSASGSASDSNKASLVSFSSESFSSGSSSLTQNNPFMPSASGSASDSNKASAVPFSSGSFSSGSSSGSSSLTQNNPFMPSASGSASDSNKASAVSFSSGSSSLTQNNPFMPSASGSASDSNKASVVSYSSVSSSGSSSLTQNNPFMPSASGSASDSNKASAVSFSSGSSSLTQNNPFMPSASGSASGRF